VHSLTSEGHDASEDGTGRGTPIVAEHYIVQPLAIRGREGGAELEAGEVGAPANALRSAGGGGGGGGSLYPLVSISSDDTPVGVAENQQGEIRESDTVGSLSLGGGKPGQGYQAVRQETIVRRLTELECERLQGYPDGWTEGQTASARYRQLGNSVAVPCVEWIARRLIATDKEINQ
jgi:DNA (cytosine-5)-methyltransferase 1